jgi:hypothetical protein
MNSAGSGVNQSSSKRRPAVVIAWKALGLRDDEEWSLLDPSVVEAWKVEGPHEN